MTTSGTSPRGPLSRGGLTFRPATLDEFAVLEADVETALFPDEPVDPGTEAHWFASLAASGTFEAFAVLDADRAVGHAWQRHQPWELMPERYGRVMGDVFPADRTSERLRSIYDFVEDRSRSEGARTFTTNAREDDPTKIGVLTGRGYVEKRRSLRWELDLVKHRERLLAMTESCRAKLREQGIALLTLERDTDPEKFRKLHALTNEAAADVPRTVPFVPDTFEAYLKMFENPGLQADRIWVARRGGDIVGISMLEYPLARGHVWTAWTGTARAVRGRGVARALKLESVAQAIALGVLRVRTDNDGENKPILHLNEQLGYERIRGWLQLHKSAGPRRGFLKRASARVLASSEIE